MPLFSTEQIYTKELYKEYAWCAYDKSKAYRKFVIAITGLMLVIALFAVFCKRYVAAVIFLLAIPIYPFIIKKAMDKQIESAWNSNKAIQNKKFHVDFYEEYFRTQSDTGSNTIEYEKLYGFMESEHTIALMLGNNNGYMLDKSCMPTELIDFLRTKVKEIG